MPHGSQFASFQVIELSGAEVSVAKESIIGRRLLRESMTGGSSQDL